MSRQIYVYRDGKLVPKAEAAPLYAAPMVIRDQMDALLHPATGQMIDSKSKFRQTTKDAGCIEVGTSSFPAPKRTASDLKKDVGRAFQMVRDGYKPSMQNIPGVKGTGWHE